MAAPDRIEPLTRLRAMSQGLTVYGPTGIFLNPKRDESVRNETDASGRHARGFAHGQVGRRRSQRSGYRKIPFGGIVFERPRASRPGGRDLENPALREDTFRKREILRPVRQGTEERAHDAFGAPGRTGETRHVRGRARIPFVRRIGEILARGGFRVRFRGRKVSGEGLGQGHRRDPRKDPDENQERQGPGQRVFQMAGKSAVRHVKAASPFMETQTVRRDPFQGRLQDRVPFENRGVRKSQGLRIPDGRQVIGTDSVEPGRIQAVAREPPDGEEQVRAFPSAVRMGSAKSVYSGEVPLIRPRPERRAFQAGPGAQDHARFVREGIRRRPKGRTPAAPVVVSGTFRGVPDHGIPAELGQTARMGVIP